MYQRNVESRIQVFRDGLGILPDKLMVQRHITFGESYVLNDDEYFQLKYEISEHFKLHPSQVIVVGSGKLGFSIAPRKRYQHFGDESDLDVAIVSDHLFQSLWRAAFMYWRDSGYWERETEFKNYLFRGWLRPDFLPPNVELSSEWFEYFRGLTASQKFGPYKISAGVYKSWWYLELYQAIAIAQCRQQLGVTNEDNSYQP